MDRVLARQEIFSFPKCLDCILPSQPHVQCVSMERRAFFNWGLSGRDVKVNTHFHVIPTLKRVELYLHCTLRLDGVDEKNLIFFTLNNFLYIYIYFFFF